MLQESNPARNGERAYSPRQRLFRGPKPERYSIVPEGALEGRGFPGTFDARSVHRMILAQAPTWRITRRWIGQNTGWCRNKVDRVLGELRRLGYVLLIQDRDTGRYGDTEYLAFCHPSMTQDFLAQKPNVAERVVQPKPAKSKPSRPTAAPFWGTPHWGIITKKKKKPVLSNVPYSPAAEAARDGNGDVGANAGSCNQVPDDLFANDPRRAGEVRSVPSAPEAERPANPFSEIISEAVAAYNAVAERRGLPRCKKFGEARTKALHATLAEVGGIEGWLAMCAELDASRFLQGGGPSGWRAGIDYMMRPEKRLMILEGGFNDENMGINVREKRDAERAALRAEYAARDAARSARQSGSGGAGALAVVADSIAPTQPAAPVDPEEVERDEKLRRKLLVAADESVNIHHRTIIDLSVPKSWLAKGCDLERDILPAITAKVRTRKGDGPKFFSWAIFTDDVNAKHAKCMAEYREMVDRYAKLGFMEWAEDGKIGRWLPHKFDHDMWCSIMTEFCDPFQGINHRIWFAGFGPAPGEPGCLVTPDQLERWGFLVPDGAWEVWKERLDEVKRIDQSYLDASQLKLEARMAKIEELERKGIKRRGLGSFSSSVSVRDVLKNGGSLIAPTVPLEPEPDSDDVLAGLKP